MDKIGIPRSIFYYYFGDIWTNFFDYLKIPYIISPKTNKQIILEGQKISNDEMCLAMKNYLGHVKYLENKCDYILIPRIDNFYLDNQTCTNFLSAYDIANNLINTKILNYNIDLNNEQTLKDGLIKIGKELNISNHKIKKAYKYAITKEKEKKQKEKLLTEEKLKSKKTKILLLSHPYNTYDDLIGKDIIKYLKTNNIEIIYSDKLASKEISNLSIELSKDLYFKYEKDNLGALVYTKDKIDGVIFLSVFPCALDSLVNELAMRKIKLPYINLVLDSASSFTGIETRLESFIDILKGRVYD